MHRKGGWEEVIGVFLAIDTQQWQRGYQNKLFHPRGANLGGQTSSKLLDSDAVQDVGINYAKQFVGALMRFSQSWLLEVLTAALGNNHPSRIS